VPQFAGSFPGFTQTLPHFRYGLVHVKLHTPEEHDAVELAGCGHEEQTAPAVPHADTDSLAYPVQLPPTVLVQHPLAHVLPSHTHWPEVLSHSCDPPQGAHVAPPTPQEDPDCAA
jgi:hypothetical protein